VVSLIASSTEMVAALDCADRLVGISHECDYPAWIRSLPPVTRPKFALDGSSYAIDQRVRAILEQGVSVYAVDAEALAALAPDLIVTQTQCEVCAVSLRDLEDAACTLMPSRPRIVALDTCSLVDLWRDFQRVADALGVAEKGAATITRLRGYMDAIATHARALRPRPRVACIEWIDPLMAAGHWLPELVEMAGGSYVTGEAGAHAPRLDWDGLAAADPDVILITPCGFDLARTRIEVAALETHPRWRELRAVRDGRVALGDGSAYFNRPGPRVVETLEIVAEVLHPDVFAFGHEGKGWEWLARVHA
jgi:iron complex transport system substrate-binding protein